MRMFRIKMTAARTNPQQIREVRIDSEKRWENFWNLSVLYMNMGM